MSVQDARESRNEDLRGTWFLAESRNQSHLGGLELEKCSIVFSDEVLGNVAVNQRNQQRDVKTLPAEAGGHSLALHDNEYTHNRRGENGQDSRVGA